MKIYQNILLSTIESTYQKYLVLQTARYLDKESLGLQIYKHLNKQYSEKVSKIVSSAITKRLLDTTYNSFEDLLGHQGNRCVFKDYKDLTKHFANLNERKALKKREKFKFETLCASDPEIYKNTYGYGPPLAVL